jgi:hypothetical protein
MYSANRRCSASSGGRISPRRLDHQGHPALAVRLGQRQAVMLLEDRAVAAVLEAVQRRSPEHLAEPGRDVRGVFGGEGGKNGRASLKTPRESARLFSALADARDAALTSF